jgi:hypothetical protein
MFTPREREQLREQLVSAAKEDPRICAAAHTGSVATGRQDRWSDIDLALSVASNSNLEAVIADWTHSFYSNHKAVAHCDVFRGTTLYRVFLLENTLQVDISFWRASEFGAVGPNFSLIFGTANSPRPAPQARTQDLIGLAWLYALHVRSSIARGRIWQTEYMLNGMRENTLALACLRCGVLAQQGRGLDDLPAEIKNSVVACLVGSLEIAELKRAFRATMHALLREIHLVDAELASRLHNPLNDMLNSVTEEK